MEVFRMTKDQEINYWKDRYFSALTQLMAEISRTRKLLAERKLLNNRLLKVQDKVFGTRFEGF